MYHLTIKSYLKLFLLHINEKKIRIFGQLEILLGTDVCNCKVYNTEIMTTSSAAGAVGSPPGGCREGPGGRVGKSHDLIRGLGLGSRSHWPASPRYMILQDCRSRPGPLPFSGVSPAPWVPRTPRGGGGWLQEGRDFKAQGSRVVVRAPTCRPHQGTARGSGPGCGGLGTPAATVTKSLSCPRHRRVSKVN